MLAIEAERAIFVADPLQILDVLEVVKTGVGFTDTVMAKDGPAQPPVVEVGLIMYATVPTEELLGLVST